MAKPVYASQVDSNDLLLQQVMHDSMYNESIPDAACYIHEGTMYVLNRLMFLCRPPTQEEKAGRQPEVAYAYDCSRELPIKAVKDMNKTDPSVCLSSDGVDICDIYKELIHSEFLICKKGSMVDDNCILVLADNGKCKDVVNVIPLREGSSLLMLPLRPYSFHHQLLPSLFEDCEISLHVFLPGCAPVMVVTGDMSRLVCMLNANFNPLYPPIRMNGKLYRLDGWKQVNGSGLSSFSRFTKLKQKEIKSMDLPNPLKKPVAPPAEAPVEPPAEPLPTRAVSIEDVPPVKPMPRPGRKVARPVPAPEPAGSPGDSVTVEELKQSVRKEPQVETFDQPVNATEQPMDPAEPVTGEEEQCDIPKSQATQPDREMTQAEYAALRKRTRTKAPTKQVGFDFTAVQEYLGSSIDPATADADVALQEIKTLRDIGILAFRRMVNLTNVVKDASSASDAKLKALAEILGK